MQVSVSHPTTSMEDCPTAPSLFLVRLFRQVLPEARRHIAYWTGKAQQIPDETLRHQALSSLQHKRFHADGGCVYAAAATAKSSVLVQLIVALQTISDYLDNLCDRCDTFDERDFEQLHHAMRDAIQPDAPLRPYYLMRNSPDDGGYLAQLVRTCQQAVQSLPSYASVLPDVTWLVERYCELQQIKHIEPSDRSPRLQAWWAPYQTQFPDLHWWEFAAATGSTLGMFALFTAATAQPQNGVPTKALFATYFPWVGGLHILLDYLIDLEEDTAEGDFNFVRCYPPNTAVTARLRSIAQRSLQGARSLSGHSAIHAHVVRGLLAMYLSDPKSRRHAAARRAKRLVLEFGPTVWLFYGACVLYRFVR